MKIDLTKREIGHIVEALDVYATENEKDMDGEDTEIRNLLSDLTILHGRWDAMQRIR